jgi:hypothetical protein
MKIAEDLSTAKILRHIDDVDVEVCRLNRNVSMAAVATGSDTYPVVIHTNTYILIHIY